MDRDNSEAMLSACIHGMQPGAVKIWRDGAGLYIYLDPRSRVSIRIDRRPGHDDWEASRLGLEELSRAAAQAAREIAGLQAAAQEDDFIQDRHVDLDPNADEAEKNDEGWSRDD